MTPPLLSLIVPNHNHTEHLPRLFDSILAQQCPNVEIVLVDDYSDTSCQPIVETYRNQGMQITFIPQTKRIFTHEARLLGAMMAQASVIAFADADDMLYGDDSLRRNINFFYESDTDILHYRSIITDINGNFIRYAHYADPFFPELKGDNVLSGFIAGDFWGSSAIWNKFFNKNLFLDNMSDLRTTHISRYREDAWTNIVLMTVAQKYVASNVIGYGYFWKEQKENPDPEQWLSLFKLNSMSSEFLRKKGRRDVIPELLSEIDKSLCSNIGRMSLSLNIGHGEHIYAEEIYKHPESILLIEALLRTTALNAEKILSIYDCFKR